MARLYLQAQSLGEDKVAIKIHNLGDRPIAHVTTDIDGMCCVRPYPVAVFTGSSIWEEGAKGNVYIQRTIASRYKRHDAGHKADRAEVSQVVYNSLGAISLTAEERLENVGDKALRQQDLVTVWWPTMMRQYFAYPVCTQQVLSIGYCQESAQLPFV